MSTRLNKNNSKPQKRTMRVRFRHLKAKKMQSATYWKVELKNFTEPEAN